MERGADVCFAFIGPDSRSSIDCMTRARIARHPGNRAPSGTGTQTGARRTLCCSACEHPAIDHDAGGCNVNGPRDDCLCPGYDVDPDDLV
jgi:hypothetical protein